MMRERFECAQRQEMAAASADARRRAEQAACDGIDTAHLWPGAMGEMVEALVSAEELLRLAGYGSGQTVGNIVTILAKLGKV